VQEILAGIATIFQILVSSPATATLSIVGLMLLALAGFLAYLAFNSKPAEMPAFIPILLYFSLVGGMLFSAAGPGLALFWVSQQKPLLTISRDTAFVNLENNERVRWLLRLVQYKATYPESPVGKFDNLGPPEQRFTFVGAYDELAGYSAKEAAVMSGLEYDNTQNVYAIALPLAHYQLYPANARGLLQVIQQVEAQNNAEIQKPFLRDQHRLYEPELIELEELSIDSYQIMKFRDKYRHYCELAQEFRCDKSYTAHKYIGGISRDWHPLGFAKWKRTEGICPRDANYDPNTCTFSDWGAAKRDLMATFGSRAFFVQNLKVDQVPNRILIDFANPEHQLVPDIGLPKSLSTNAPN
jgi:hypothetical protein